MNIHYKAKLSNGPNTDLKTASCYDSFRYIRTTLCRLCSVLQIRQEPFGYHFTKPIIVKFVKKDCIETFFRRIPCRRDTNIGVFPYLFE